jgi:hypothetical protein
MRSRRTGPEAIKRAQRISAILSMRLSGYTLADIGQSMNPPVSAVAIHKTLKKALAAMLIEPFEMRLLELARLDELTAAVYPAALNGDVAAIDRCLAISVRRARLTGLDLQRALCSRSRPAPDGGRDRRRPGASACGTGGASFAGARTSSRMRVARHNASVEAL